MMQSRIGLRSIGRQSISLYRKSGKVDARLFSTGSYSDRDLQLEFSTVGTFWKKAWNLLFDSQERERYYSLQKSGVLPKDSYWSPVWTYICLENPLLKKYDVRGADIIEGAKFSYEAVNQALSTTDFYEHLRGTVETSESHDFLSSVQSPEVYTAWRASSKQFDATGMRFSLKSLEVTNVAIRNVVTKIVPGDVPAETEYMTDLERAAYVEASEWLDKVLKSQQTGKKGDVNTTGSPKDTLEPPVAVKSVEKESEKVAVKANVVEPLHNTTPSAGPVTPITTPIVPPTTASPTDTPSSVAPTNTVAASTPATTPAATPVSPVVATPSNTPTVTPETFSVQPATRRATRSIAPARTGTESSAVSNSAKSTAVPGTPVVTTSSSSSGEVEKYDEVYHIPPITAEGTPVQVEHHEHHEPTSSNTTSATTANTTEGEKEAEPAEAAPAVNFHKTVYERDFELFPPGSVLAYVDVQIKAKEESEILLDKSIAHEGQPIKVEQKKDRDVMWSYRACISGQVPLEWQLVDINGGRAEAFRA